LEGLARDTWPAFWKWTDEFLEEQVGDEVVRVERVSLQSSEFAYFSKDFGHSDMPFREFSRQLSSPHRQFNLYMAEQPLLEQLQADVEAPFLSEFLEVDKVLVWDGVGTKSLPHQDEVENVMCVLRGSKKFFIASPFQTDKVYGGQKQGAPKNYSPVDFQSPDLSQFPLFAQATVYEADIQAGDCLFLPALWWHQVNSAPSRTIAVNHWWQAHSLAVSSWNEHAFWAPVD
jgi:hypothetical protein